MADVLPRDHLAFASTDPSGRTPINERCIQVSERIDLIRRGLALGANVEANRALNELEVELDALRIVNEMSHEEIEGWIEAGRVASECIQHLRQEKEMLEEEIEEAGKIVDRWRNAAMDNSARIVVLEGVLRRIAEDSRPYAGWTAQFHSAVEHWKHVASQRREWAIEALRNFEPAPPPPPDSKTPPKPKNVHSFVVSAPEEPRIKGQEHGPFGRNPGWE